MRADLVSSSGDWQETAKQGQFSPSGFLFVQVDITDLTKAVALCSRRIADHLIPYNARYVQPGRVEEHRGAGSAMHNENAPRPSPPSPRLAASPPRLHKMDDARPRALPGREATTLTPREERELLTRFKTMQMNTEDTPEEVREKFSIRREQIPKIEAKALRELGVEQDFIDVLVSFRSIIPDEKFRVLEAELNSFAEEYHHGHYTSCGLRIGRTLEHIVYALALSWNVRVNRVTLHILADLESSFDRLSSTLIAHASASEDDKLRSRKSVQDHCGEISRKLFDLASKIENQMDVVTTNVPINMSLSCATLGNSSRSAQRSAMRSMLLIRPKSFATL